MKVFNLVFVFTLLAHSCQGGGYVYKPQSRNAYYFGAWKGPSNTGEFNGGGPIVDQNGGSNGGHGICGGDKLGTLTNLMEEWVWSTLDKPQAVYESGQWFDMEIVIDDPAHGYFELRLCDRTPFSPKNKATTQACLNQHVLEFDVAYAKELYAGKMRYGSDPSHYAAIPIGDQCGNLLNKGPVGSCCRTGGECSNPSDNKHRFVVPEANLDGPNKESLYVVRYKLPDKLVCENCVLQWYRQDGNINGGFPKGTWNCVDIKIVPATSATSDGDGSGGIVDETSAFALVAISAAGVMVLVIGFAFHKKVTSDSSIAHQQAYQFNKQSPSGNGTGGPMSQQSTQHYGSQPYAQQGMVIGSPQPASFHSQGGNTPNGFTLNQGNSVILNPPPGNNPILSRYFNKSMAGVGSVAKSFSRTSKKFGGAFSQFRTSGRFQSYHGSDSGDDDATPAPPVPPQFPPRKNNQGAVPPPPPQRPNYSNDDSDDFEAPPKPFSIHRMSIDSDDV